MIMVEVTKIWWDGERLMAEPVDSSIMYKDNEVAQPDSTCNKTLRAEGKGYPRTCKKCGKGPCIADRVQPAQQCRTDGRCQYAIDSGAEGMGHCPKGKCVMPAQQEPVAWIVEDRSGERLEWASDAHSCHGVPTFPLYTSPPAQRKPMTDEEISDLWCKVSNTDFVTADTHVFARAIEAAHGIKEK